MEIPASQGSSPLICQVSLSSLSSLARCHEDGEENRKLSRRGRIVNPSRLDKQRSKQRRNDGNLPSGDQPWVLPGQLN